MKRVSWLSLFCLILILVSPAYALKDDDAWSQHIAEADGTTGQETNFGTGIKTGHIQDGAITATKLAVGAVSTDTIQSGAVTDAKISGQISASKISSIGLDADTIDGLHASQLGFDRNFSNIVVVAKQGGDFDNIKDAMDSISDASSQNPYLIKIMPGVYDSGIGSFGLKDYVDIEGSGLNVTKLILHGAIYGTDAHSTISELSIEVQGNGSACVGGNYSVNGFDIGGTNNNVTLDKVYLAISNGTTGFLIRASGNINILNSTLKNLAGSCSAKTGIILTPGAYNNFLVIKNSEVAGGYSSYNLDSAIVANATNASDIRVYDSTISASTWAIGAINGSSDKIYLYSNNSVFTASNIYYPTVDLKPTDVLKAVNTQFDGGLTKPDPANVKMFNCYNGNYDLIAN